MNTGKIHFRQALAEDAQTITDLINSAYRGDSARGGWTHEADLVDGLRIDREEFLSLIRSPKDFILLACEGSSILGCVHVRREERSLYFGMLSVSPGLQNSGIGAALLREVDARARNEGKCSVRLSVIHTREELIAYYRRKGFSPTGHSDPFPEQYPARIPGLRLMEMQKTL